jgi:hypothetical protein
MRANKYFFLMILAMGFLFIHFNLVSALSRGTSNQSLGAVSLIDDAKICIGKMQSLNISTARVNESYNKAVELYEGQFLQEQQGKKANYAFANDSALEVCTIEGNAIKANDELQVFLEFYNNANKEINLSAMDKEYGDIIASFSGERFEDTSRLIDIGYQRISEIQSSQTALNLFYSTTSQGIKNFLKNNWKGLSIGGVVVLLILIFFWKAIVKFRIKRKLNYLNLQKQTLNALIKRTQLDYFKYNKMSETEYGIKIEKFRELIRDVDRQIPLLKENMIKLQKKNAVIEEKKKSRRRK